MDTEPPGKSPGREIIERIAEAGAGSVPVMGAALAVALVTALNWKLDHRREDWFTRLAEDLAELRDRLDGFDPQNLAGNDLFVDAVVSSMRTVEHTHDEGKLAALRNAVLNSVTPDAPDADTQAAFLNLVDRFTPSHLRLLALWDDPPAWFERHGLTPPQGVMAGNRGLTVEAGLLEMRGRASLYMLMSSELETARLLTASLSGMVSGPSLMSRLTSEFGRNFVRFISRPQALE